MLLMVVQYLWRRFMFTRIFVFLLVSYMSALASLVAAVFTRGAASLGATRSGMTELLNQMADVMNGTLALDAITDVVQRDLVQGAIGVLNGVLSFFGINTGGSVGSGTNARTVQQHLGDVLKAAANKISAYPPEPAAG